MTLPGARRLRFAGADFDLLDEDAVATALAGRNADDPFAYIVTPNADHVVRLADQRLPDAAAIAAAYQAARWCLCDSRILALLARLRGRRLPVVTGSDLTARLLAAIAQPGDRIAVVGGDDAMIAALARRYPALAFVHHAPPMGLRKDAAARAAAAAFVAEAGARFTLLAVGSPQQELLAHAIARGGAARGTALCIGAAVAFLTGDARRAPRWMQQAGLEWAFRLGSDPARLWRRYLIEGPRVLPIALGRELRDLPAREEPAADQGGVRQP